MPKKNLYVLVPVVVVSMGLGYAAASALPAAARGAAKAEGSGTEKTCCDGADKAAFIYRPVSKPTRVTAEASADSGGGW